MKTKVPAEEGKPFRQLRTVKKVWFPQCYGSLVNILQQGVRDVNL